jgi:Flp pilus assembly pilin Flp
MSDLTLHTITRLSVSQRVARHAVATSVRRTAGRIADRFRREQTGQDVLEYSGMVVFVALIIGLMFTLNIPQTVATAVAHAANAMFTNNHSYTAPKAIPDPQG